MEGYSNMKKLSLFAFCLAVLCLSQNVQARVWDGKIDSEWYWENEQQTEFTISTAAQLAGLVQLVNGGNDFSGKTIKLTASIMLNDTANWRNWEKTNPKNAWTPIGNNSRPFSGTLDGGGNVISGVYINNSNDYQGLFGYIGSDATIKNLGVVASYVKATSQDDGNIGNLAGFNKGTITNCYATGNVAGFARILGKTTTGGLVGNNSGTITDCYATGDVEGPSDLGVYSAVGGLAGSNSGTITDCYATGNVKGKTAGGLVASNYGTITNCYATGNVRGETAGGLAGYNRGTIENSYATRDVNGKHSAGGLVGENENKGTIENSYATGNVRGSDYVGGLAGSNSGTITNCYATGNVNGGSYSYSAGGLVGSNYGTIANCYAMGNVASYRQDANAGGLAGYNSGTITNCYATGDVKGEYSAGGLVGENENKGTIKNSYAMGNVAGKTGGGLTGWNKSGSITNCYAMGNLAGNTSGGLVGSNGGYESKGIIENSYSAGNINGTSSTNGGLVGVNEKGTIANSYYDRQTSGQSDVVNKGEPKSTAQMKQQTIFKDWDFDGIWKIDESKNSGYPYLQSSEKSLPVKYKYANKVQQGNVLADKRDGKKYKTVVINTQTWMAENLNFNANGSKCYDNKPANCVKYGRLYDWKTAKKACPSGWHLPSDKEWDKLERYADMYASGASTYLKAASGWDKGRDYDHNGTDNFGFAALPGNDFGYYGSYGGYWWSSSSNEINSSNAYSWGIRYNFNYTYREGIGWDSNDKSYLFSVRCLQD
jgi:uncharacterized protein (TIGR02145 family)